MGAEQSSGPKFDLALVSISNPSLRREDIDPVPTPADYPCPECRKRGFIPRVHQDDCPECGGSDPYGQGVYCAECEFCCGC